jgi:deoxyribose-phosphate aldolase
MNPSYETIAQTLDHALLAPTLTSTELAAGCSIALRYGVASVCVPPYFAARAAELLAGSSVRPTATIGFPHGGHTTKTKVAEAEAALDDGAVELDMVVNIGKTLSGDFDYVRAELAAMVELLHGRGQKLKVIFENCYLEHAHKIRLCELCGELRIDWAKTSTGFGSGGATREDVALMRRHLPPQVEVKASGGIRKLDDVFAMRALGATRCGSSKSREILEEFRQRFPESGCATTP